MALHTTLFKTSILVIAVVSAQNSEESFTHLPKVKLALFKEIKKRQVLTDKKPIPGVQPLHQTGVYDCMVRFNFAGECWQKELRHRLAFFDNNPFVPIWVSTLLIEANLYGKGVMPTDEQLELSLRYLETTIDKTRGYNNSIIGFYPYIYDTSAQKYVMRKVFVEEIMNMFLDLPPALLAGFDYLLPESLRGVLVSAKQPQNSLDGCLAKVSDRTIQEEIANCGFMVMQNHTISPIFPADSDDTFSWIGLGSALKMAADKGRHTEPHESWIKMNTNLTSAFEALKYYAYRPFSSDGDKNTIDSRSYYALRHFLNEAHEAQRDVALVTTWFSNIHEEVIGQVGEMTMPTFVNDVCLAVGANVLHGITSSVLTGLVPFQIFDDPEILQLYHNTSELILHMLKNNFYDRQDLTLFYYPPKNQFFFFLSRTYFLMESYAVDKTFPVPIMKTVYKSLQKSLKIHITEYLLQMAKKDREREAIYFDDFLGDGDVTSNGRPLYRGEDRIFSTSMAANTLMYTWLVYNRETETLRWKKDVPAPVVAAIEGCIRWLINHATDPKFKPWSAFFSSGRKGFNNLPFWYPANRFQYSSGERIEEVLDALPQQMFFVAMEGYVAPQKYNEMLNQSHFGRTTPQLFPGYNAKDWNSFAIWSSEAYTFSSALLSLSLFEAIV